MRQITYLQAIGEAMRWPVGLERKPKDAVAFYAVLAVAVLLGLGLNLLHLDPVGVDLRKIWFQPNLHGHFTSLGLIFGQSNNLANDLVQAEPGFDRFAIFQKRANPGNNLTRPVAVTNDSLKRIACFA